MDTMTGYPAIMPVNSGYDGFGGGGVMGGLLLGALLGGNGGLFNRGFGGGYGGNYGGGCYPPVAAYDEANEARFQGVNSQISNLSGQINSNSITDQIQDCCCCLDQGITSVNQNISGTTRDIIQTLGNVATAQAAANFTTLSSINGLGRDITAQTNQNALQQLNSFNNLTTTTLQGFNTQAMQLQNSTNQIIAQGTANAAAVAAGFCGISRELAECCCEIKGLIRDDGAATRSLINDLNVQNLRDQLAAANNKISNNDQNQYLLNTILHHITPAPAPHVIV